MLVVAPRPPSHDRLDGLAKVFTTSSPKYKGIVAEPLAPVLKFLVDKNSYTHIFAAHTAHGRDVFPRLAALLDVSQVSDIIAVDSEDTFQRPIYAGNAIATVKSSDKVKVVTVRGTAFEKAAIEGGSAAVEEIGEEAADGESRVREQMFLSLWMERRADRRRPHRQPPSPSSRRRSINPRVRTSPPPRESSQAVEVSNQRRISRNILSHSQTLSTPLSVPRALPSTLATQTMLSKLAKPVRLLPRSCTLPAPSAEPFSTWQV